MTETSSVSRRRLFSGAAGLAAAALAPATATAAVRLGDDGLYTEDWYVESFLDLSEDLSNATAKGRHFALQWSQRGCVYCKTLHTVYFADPAIEGPVKAAFDIVHLDLFGAREVTAFDGARLTEKALGSRERIRATPTFQFFALDGGRAREVARMPGLLPPPDFSAMFRYVAAGAYARESFEAWLAREGKKS
ncbi:thioredoxin family protein [Xanthobacter autotrophicus DSM 431]|uniref:SoxW family protein n=1 Tax=Xanthobacter nonsaccharivorans TaxID=3119912 RepID=UPI003729CD33